MPVGYGPRPRNTLPSENPVKIFISGATIKNPEGTKSAGGGVWYGTNDDRNIALRMPEHTPSATSAEIHAALEAVQRADPETALKIFSTAKSLRNAMVRDLGKWEDRGWIGIADKMALQALAACLRGRSAQTTFETIQKDQDTGKDGLLGAANLAREGAKKSNPDQFDLQVEGTMKLKGVKLSSLTQALAYAGIKGLKARVSRKATDNNVKQVQMAAQQTYGRIPAPAVIWKSIRHKDFSRQLRNFLWKCMHDAHRIGKFWKHIPDSEDRGICQFCGETEDLEHILLKCERPGQQLVWDLAEKLWLKKHPVWPTPSLGAILGCGLVVISDDKGRPLPGASRLYRILISESIFIIWKVRNSSVISQGGQSLSNTEIQNRWLHAINQRLNLDRTLTNRARYGKQFSVKPDLVLQTWSSTLKDEEELPDDWLRVPKVLVGIEPLRPPSPPAGRRGRNR
ncbi:ribonuclease H-like protein [Mycena leptocephala]|nr:ribonuclease H-like protein [Mycena leptocephala]